MFRRSWTGSEEKQIFRARLEEKELMTDSGTAFQNAGETSTPLRCKHQPFPSTVPEERQELPRCAKPSHLHGVTTAQGQTAQSEASGAFIPAVQPGFSSLLSTIRPANARPALQRAQRSPGHWHGTSRLRLKKTASWSPDFSKNTRRFLN